MRVLLHLFFRLRNTFYFTGGSFVAVVCFRQMNTMKSHFAGLLTQNGKRLGLILLLYRLTKSL